VTGATVLRLARWGLLLGLLLATIAAPGVYAVAAGGLLFLHALAFFGILAPPARLALSVATAVTFPSCAEAAGAGAVAALGGALALPWIHTGLQDLASTGKAGSAEGDTAAVHLGGQGMDLSLSPNRSAAPLARALGLVGVLVIGVGIAAGRGVVASAGGLLLAWLLATIGFVFLRMRPQFAGLERIKLRVVAGQRSEATTSLVPATRLPCTVRLTAPSPWADVHPSAFCLDGVAIPLRLILAPPLAGPAVLSVEAVATDPWGLTHTRQSLDVADLHIIPRARYAAWLARLYLERTSTGPTIARTSATRRPGLRGGVEFYGARTYAPGDGLRDIDWKHTAKLRNLVVKEFRAVGSQAAILLVGLEAVDADQADRLAYRLVTTALTLAREGVPIVLAAYTRGDVVRVTPLLAPREAVREALDLTKRLVRVLPVRRTLAYPSLGRLRRIHGQLNGGQAGRRLADFIALEMRVLIEGASVHPATRALRAAVARAGRPAVVLEVSVTEDHKPILDVALERLGGLGYRLIATESAMDGISPGSSRAPAPRATLRT
jgi:uncharacterized protein (DUF58 family)